jgi:hypothetical protein
MDNFDIVAKLHGLVCSEAGCRDLRISMTAKLAIYEIEKLRKERDEAKSKLGRIMEGLEGTCMTCEPVGVRNQQMVQDIKTLQAERDEARREVSKLMGGSAEQHWYANRRGWCCFKEIENGEH